MVACPECLGSTLVIKGSVKRCSNGSMRRRRKCKSCGYRWTFHEGEPPGHRGGFPKGQKHSFKPLSIEEVRLILIHDGSIGSIARQLGRSHPAVSAVIRGRTHADLFPDLPRRLTDLSCLSCDHWRGCCGLGFPDPEEDGLQAANSCNSYRSKMNQ